jgi:hypothetical protein
MGVCPTIDVELIGEGLAWINNIDKATADPLLWL